LERGGFISLTAIDFKKAFDKVSHSVLLDKSNSLLNPTQVSWLKSFLSDRLQRVLSSEHPDDIPWIPLSSGVPQGSVIGPFAFCILVNDLGPLFECSKLIMYADDVTLLHHFQKESSDRTQLELDMFHQWAVANKLTINREKCFSMILGSPSSELLLYKIDDLTITTVTQIKILGFIISNDFSLVPHCKYIFDKAFRGLYPVRLLMRSGAPQKARCVAFWSFVFSHLAFAWPAICHLPALYKKKLTSLEKQFSVLCGAKVDLLSKLDNICIRLAKQIGNAPKHPLRECFFERPQCLINLRKIQKFHPLPSKKIQLRNSFTKFAVYA
jgi:hypothetical protein